MKAILPLLLAGSLLHAEDKAAQKDISAVYQQIEAGFKTWPHYTYSAENLEGGG